MEKRKIDGSTGRECKIENAILKCASPLIRFLIDWQLNEI